MIGTQQYGDYRSFCPASISGGSTRYRRKPFKTQWKNFLADRLKNPHPLSGLKIWVTRAKSAGNPGKLCRLLEACGAETIHAPVVEIVSLDQLPQLQSGLDREIRQLNRYSTIVFVSSTGVTFFLQRIQQLLDGLGSLPQKQIVGIGPGTVDRLAVAGLDSQQPPASNSKALGEFLVRDEIEEPVLIVRADRGSRELGSILSSAGRRFEEVVAYAIQDRTESEKSVLTALASGQINWVVATSSAIATATMNLYGNELRANNKANDESIRIMCISNAVADVFREQGMRNVFVAKVANFVGVRDSLLEVVGG